MHEKLPISVHILTWNSQRTLERALESVRDCAEILIIDGGSTDDTLAVAEKFGARVLPQRFPGAQAKPLADFGAARNVGLQHATQLWILALDSDELMSPSSMEEIRESVSTNPGHGAYWVPRHYVSEDGTVIARASTYPNERLYFFRRDAAEQWIKPVHERIALKPGVTIGRLRSGSLAPLPSLGTFTMKLNQYLQIEVEHARGERWAKWFSRLLHTLRGRMVAAMRLLRIWLLPGGKRLPFRYEIARFRYAWKLVVRTCPLFQSAS